MEQSRAEHIYYLGRVEKVDTVVECSLHTHLGNLRTDLTTYNK